MAGKEDIGIIQAVKDDANSASFNETTDNTEISNKNQMPLDEEQLATFIASMSVDDDDTSMETMLHLMSKEILYPILKDASSKYPDWLEENRCKMASKLFVKYQLQHELMQQACQEIEAENAADEQTVKDERYDTILDLVQQIQECVQPPQELAASIISSMLEDPAAAQSCCIT